jgi:hypothetical protein
MCRTLVKSTLPQAARETGVSNSATTSIPKPGANFLKFVFIGFLLISRISGWVMS